MKERRSQYTLREPGKGSEKNLTGDNDTNELFVPNNQINSNRSWEMTVCTELRPRAAESWLSDLGK